MQNAGSWSTVFLVDHTSLEFDFLLLYYLEDLTLGMWRSQVIFQLTSFSVDNLSKLKI